MELPPWVLVLSTFHFLLFFLVRIETTAQYRTIICNSDSYIPTRRVHNPDQQLELILPPWEL